MDGCRRRPIIADGNMPDVFDAHLQLTIITPHRRLWQLRPVGLLPRRSMWGYYCIAAPPLDALNLRATPEGVAEPKHRGCRRRSCRTLVGPCCARHRPVHHGYNRIHPTQSCIAAAHLRGICVAAPPLDELNLRATPSGCCRTKAS